MKRKAFTLVEILTVIVIIGILASLITGASIAVRTAVKRAIIVSEIKQLEIAVQMYKTEVGEYPPDFTFCYHADPAVRDRAREEVLRHCRKRWPRVHGMTFPMIEAVCHGGPSPATALQFWLGGIRDPDGSDKLVGFSQDPSNPFKAGNPRKMFYKFGDDSNKSRLIGGMFFPPGIKEAPYVYFRSRKINDNGRDEYGMVVGSGPSAILEVSSHTLNTVAATAGVAVAYLEDAVGGNDATVKLEALLALSPTVLDSVDRNLVKRNWKGEGQYQILASGWDGTFSTEDLDGSVLVSPQRWRLVPDLSRDLNWPASGIWFSDGDFDNIASFASGELEDSK